MKALITDRARFEAERRNITEELIKSVVENPQQKLSARKGRVVFQNRYYDEVEEKEMLLRVIGIKVGEAFKVVTVYKTSKIDKYWMKGG